MLFVGVRRSLSRIAVDAGLLADVARRLQALDRWEGKARMTRDLERAAMRLEEEIRLHRGRA